ncbi:hypothetical protein NQK81_21355 [Amycolatopsis roodepoortensis]|uniref:hypothetical protein n=1 Tax=Amycolatopsis roodepoortensis TaxID=700274 RepID=UPI00214CBE95|nr:hypothetical protein [Amycolatopsis roodepoortensis]UUV35877.1 hypothetical protein NQK81_21355 [Amycolatopsis roodepoortensis]
MPGRRHATPVARGSLARLVAVIGALVGLVVLQGSPCPDEFHALGYDPLCATTTIEPAGLTMPDIAHEAGPPGDQGALTPQDSQDLPTGVAELCLALLVAVLLIATGLMRPGLFPATTPRAGQPLAPQGRRPRAPSLATLCVLRT